MGGFEEIEHTADYALRVWGQDLRDLIESAGRGLLYLLLGEQKPAATSWVEYEVEAPDAAALVLRCLRELLYRVDEGEVPVALEVTQADEEPPTANCRLGLVPLAQGKSYLHRELKAVTYHDLIIKREATGLSLTLTFDT